MMNNKVWVLGDAVVDLLPDAAEGRLIQCPGGAPANVAVGVARLGGNSAFIGRVGDDPFGRFLRTTLAAEHVDVQHMQSDPERRTSTVVVSLDDEGERTFTFMVQPSADLFLQPCDLPNFQADEWLHVCSIALSAEPSRSTTFLAMERIRQAGGRVSFDPNIRHDLWQSEAMLRTCLQRALCLSNVVKLSEEELIFISGTPELALGMAQLAAMYPFDLLLVTQGKAGVQVYFHGEIIHFTTRPVISIDTTGAGDAFVAGILSGLALQGIPQTLQQLTPIIDRAQTCGAMATTAKGAMTALPYLTDILAQA